jgi:hypothetical protein
MAVCFASTVPIECIFGLCALGCVACCSQCAPNGPDRGIKYDNWEVLARAVKSVDCCSCVSCRKYCVGGCAGFLGNWYILDPTCFHLMLFAVDGLVDVLNTDAPQ